MRQSIRRAFAVAVTLVLFGAAAIPGSRAGEMPAKPKIGDKAPDFTLQSLQGQSLQLSKVTGSKVVVLVFWSLRCGACLTEIPHLNNLQKAWADRGATVLSVVTDGMDADETKTIMKESGISPAYPVLLDADFATAETYTNFIMPHTLVIDRKGVIRYVHTGFAPGVEKEYEAAVAAALRS